MPNALRGLGRRRDAATSPAQGGPNTAPEGGVIAGRAKPGRCGRGKAMRVRTQPPRARYHARDTTVLTHTLIATLGPMLTLLPVLAVLFAPWHRRGPVAIKIDGRHYRGAPGTIEHEEQKMTPKQTNKTTADVGLSSRVNRRSRGGSRDAVAGARPPETSQGRRRQDREVCQ